MINILRKLGVEPQGIEQPLDLTIPENKMMLAFYLAAPEVENDRRALNTFHGMRRARKEGRYMGYAPAGYVNKVKEDGTKYIAFDQPEASILKWAFEDLSKGIFNTEQVLCMAKEKGLKASKNNFWRAIRNPLYCGKIMIPKYKEVDFGTLQQPIKLYVGYEGKEDDQYKNMMGTASVTFKPNKKLTFTLDNFAYQNREKEYYSIASGYLLQAFDPATGDPIATYDAGGQIDHARNDLLARVYGTQLRAKYSPDANTDFELGVKYEKEKLKDLTNEWQLVDSLGYSVPRSNTIPGILDASQLKLRYQITGNNDINPIRISGYAQVSKKFYWGESRVFVNAGVRAQHWDFNNETIISPRAQFAIKPNWDADMLFRFSGGIYYQAPFYKEIKDLDGSFNSDIKSQKSIQFIAANDYEFKMVDRPFKLTTELYYKKMSNLIPYYLDNVRIRYAGDNNSEGYAYGVDARLFGEFVPGVDSWISASYARTKENIDGMGYISRPTDQRFRISMFYQDFMPKFPSMKVNLMLVFANGLPSGSPIVIDSNTGLPNIASRYVYQKNLPSYKRVDIGLTKVFIDQKDNKASGNFWGKFKELALGVQIFNAFNINNTIANQWVTDVNSSNIYPVPVRLTGRFFNVKLEFKF